MNSPEYQNQNLAPESHLSEDGRESNPAFIDDFGTMRIMDLRPKKGVSGEEYATARNPQSTWKLQYCRYCDRWGEYNANLFKYWTYESVLRCMCVDCCGNPEKKKAAREPVKIKVPDMYMDANLASVVRGFDGPTQRTILNYPGSQRLMVFVGINGVGKTHALWAVFKDLARRGIQTVFKEAKDLRQDWMHDMDGRQALLGGLADVPVLGLDDISEALETPGWAEDFSWLINKRIENVNTATLMTTSASPDQIRQGFGSAFADRMKYFYTVQILGESKRRPE